MAIGYIHSLNAAIDLKNYSTDERFDHAHIDTFPNNRQQKARMLLKIDKEKLSEPLTILNSLP